MFDRHKESTKHRESENLFAAKHVAHMAKPACCHSTKNTLCGLDSWRRVSVHGFVQAFAMIIVSDIGDKTSGEKRMTYMLVFELRVLGLWDPRYTCHMF